MIEPPTLYKICLRYDWSGALNTLQSMTARGMSVTIAGVPVTIPFDDNYLNTAIEQVLSDTRAEAIDSAMKFMDGIGRRDNLLNTYANLDRETGQAIIMFVLDDRDAALMLKLSAS